MNILTRNSFPFVFKEALLSQRTPKFIHIFHKRRCNISIFCLRRINQNRYNAYKRWFTQDSKQTVSKLSRESSSGYKEDLVSSALKMEEQMMQAMRLQSQSNFRRSSLFLALAGFGAYVLWPTLKGDAGKEMADVATVALSDNQLIQSSEHLAKSVVQTVLNDPATLKEVTELVVRLSKEEWAQKSVASLLQQSITQPETIEHATILARQVVASLLSDTETKKQVTDFCKELLRDPNIRSSVGGLFQSVLSDKYVLAAVTDLVNSVIVEDSFKKTSSDLGIWVAHEILDNDSVYNHSKEFTTGVLSDYEVQASAGDALWNSVKYVVSPGGWFGSSEEEEEEKESIKNIVDTSVDRAAQREKYGGGHYDDDDGDNEDDHGSNNAENNNDDGSNFEGSGGTEKTEDINKSVNGNAICEIDDSNKPEENNRDFVNVKIIESDVSNESQFVPSSILQQT